MIRYVPPRKAELDKEEKGSVFDDKRTREKEQISTQVKMLK